MGKTANEILGDFADIVESKFQHVLTTGQAVHFEASAVPPQEQKLATGFSTTSPSKMQPELNLSSTSREGKGLILKTAEAGEALGLSAAISGLGYETTAETAAPSQVNFVDRRHLLERIQSQSEVGLHTAQSLSRDFHAAYRDIHDLVLSRSSGGKLARLLLSQSHSEVAEEVESRIHSSMTHEEMAQRIGASRETVTRLLSNLKRK